MRSGASASSLVAKSVLAVWVVGFPIAIGAGMHRHGQLFHALAVCAVLTLVAALAARAAVWLQRGSQKR
jgi:hypothetical protein